MKFLPTTKEEMKNLGWDSIDVLLISGDTYLDTSYNGSALVGKWLVEHGFKVGIIAQPEVDVPDDITRLGEPNLFLLYLEVVLTLWLQTILQLKREDNRMTSHQVEKIIKDQIEQF